MSSLTQLCLLAHACWFVARVADRSAGGSSHAEKEGAAYAAAHQAVQDAEDEMDTLRNSIAKAQASKRSLGGAYNEQVARRTELQLSIKDLSDRLAGIQGGKADAATQLKQLQKKIKETKAKLGQLAG